ncbi:hypothetical protein GCM10010486_71600 [Nonomuraea roseoviolacea subsp. carminata]
MVSFGMWPVVVHQVAAAAQLAATLTVGRYGRPPLDGCPHFNTITNAEWALLEKRGNDRRPLLPCELEPGHADRHSSLAQVVADRWIRVHWDNHVRELVELPYCPAVDAVADSLGGHEPCTLVDG